MINLKELKEMIELIDNSSIEHFEYEKDDEKITLKKSSATFLDMTRTYEPQYAPIGAAQSVVPSTSEDGKTQAIVECTTKQILSPMVGTFYAAPSPDSPPYVVVGDKVSDQKIVCMVEAMKLFNEIEAEVTGEIMEIHVNNGQLIEFGQPLFTVKVE